MATAKLRLPDGTQVTIEGTAEEVASLLDKVSDRGSAGKVPKSRSRGSGGKKKRATKATSSMKRKGPTDYIRELIDEGFFRTKREIGAVRDKLEEGGQIYPVTSISGPLFRLVRSRELRRIKEDGTWKYVNV
jgi:hypothetical protein